MSRKRDRSYSSSSRHVPYSFSKRRRPLPLQPDGLDPVDDIDKPPATVKKPTTVVILGLPSDCSVLDLKSRFEIYGSISRIRMDPTGLGYITFRSHDSAQSAVNAAVDPSFAVTILSKPVQVMWATDSVPQWREGVTKKDGASSSSSSSPLSSKLVRPELPLSRRGRGNKLGSAIVIPRDGHKTRYGDVKDIVEVGDRVGSGLIQPLVAREIVAYDDIL
ncbi:OLC1v1028063C1 [Oldenlandia corymbosa var. corymbosa]|uniref:OLC1v1028063C1 n=1 Tax=Oldenlandia corymbosa var. corymbosa TaxID=529605 RepID=A0AAV1CCP1_OLDCO|nr:OLC1v1028063C1 [Oldenlandia corymbosa var. corymbosa]